MLCEYIFQPPNVLITVYLRKTRVSNNNGKA